MIYRLSEATFPEIGATFPQAQEAFNRVHVKDPNHLWNLSGIGNKLPIDVIMPYPILHKKAKLTDLISTSMISLLLVISDKLKAIIEPYANADFQFLPMKVLGKKKDTEYSYWLLNPIAFKSELIDFEKSEIWVEGMGGVKLRRIETKSFLQFEEIQKKIQLPEGLVVKKLVFTRNIMYNFFSLSTVSGGFGYYVSDNLKQEIEAAGCSGIKFEPIEQA